MGPGSFDPGSAPAVRNFRADAVASMGPGSFDPGSLPDLDLRPWPQAPLQWGRGLSTPEVMECGSFWRPTSGFNGAGVFRPRKSTVRSTRRRSFLASMGPGSFDPGSDKAVILVDSALLVLQWGRGLSTPEVTDHPVGKKTYSNASMGPGSFDPGSVCVSSIARAHHSPLQWGRVFRPRKCDR